MFLNFLTTFIDLPEWAILSIIICASVFVILIILFLILFPIFKRRMDFKNFQNKYYKEIRKIADLKDYYLINNLTLRNNNQVLCKIDHVLFGDKYIYVIKDRYYRGAISGEREDNTWLFYSLKGTREEMSNPMKVNLQRLEKLAAITQIDKSFFISIVIINNNCAVKNNVELNGDNSFIVPISKLFKLVKTIENRDVKKMNENQLRYAVEDISRLYGRGKNEEK